MKILCTSIRVYRLMTNVSHHIETNWFSVNFMLKFYITFLLWQFTKIVNQVFCLSRVSEKLEICTPVWSRRLNESKNFEVILMNNFLKLGRLLVENYYILTIWFLYDCHLQWKAAAFWISACSKFFLHWKWRS